MRMTGWRRWVIFAAAVSTSAATHGVSSHAAAQASATVELTPIRATAPPALGSLPSYVAVHEGFFEERGLDVGLHDIVGGQDAMPSLGRQFDFVFNAITLWVPFIDVGHDAVLFAGTEALSEELITNPLVTNDPEIQSIADLVGKRVGVVNLGTSNIVAIKMLLEEQGLDGDEVEFVAVPFENQADQMEAGQVDAIVSATGFWEHLQDEGVRVLGDLPKDALVAAGAELPLAFAVYGATRAYAEENPDTLLAFQEAIAEAGEWIHANPSEAFDYYAEWSGRERDAVELLSIPAYEPQVTPDDITPYIDLLTAGDRLEGEIDAEAIVAQLPETDG